MSEPEVLAPPELDFRNVIHVDFTPEYRKDVLQGIKTLGVKRTTDVLISHGVNPSFVRGLCRSIVRKEGW